MSRQKDIVQEGVHTYTPEDYVMPSSPILQDKLEWFMDQKLGFMVHFGPIAQIGSMMSLGIGGLLSWMGTL